MIKKDSRHIIPLINTTSTSDISFILLVSFLLMTSMDVDKGLLRQLPSSQENDRQDIEDVKKENVMSLEITSFGDVLLDGKNIDVLTLRSKAMDFISHHKDRKSHIIALEVNRSAPYEAYFNVQNELIAAYNTLRNNYALKNYGKDYALCSSEERETIRRLYPQRIAEIEAKEEKEVKQ